MCLGGAEVGPLTSLHVSPGRGEAQVCICWLRLWPWHESTDPQHVLAVGLAKTFGAETNTMCGTGAVLLNVRMTPATLLLQSHFTVAKLHVRASRELHACYFEYFTPFACDSFFFIIIIIISSPPRHPGASLWATVHRVVLNPVCNRLGFFLCQQQKKKP